MLKNLLRALLIAVLILTGYMSFPAEANSGVLSSLKKKNYDLTKKVEELQKEIKVLRASEKVDAPKADLILKTNDLKKSYEKKAITLQKSSEKLQKIQKVHDSLEFELLDTKNEIVVLKKSNAELYSLVTKLSEKIKTISSISPPISENIPSEKN